MPGTDAGFADALLPGETILWAGQPAQGLLLLSRDLYLVPFSLLWFGFAMSWEYGVTRSHAPGLFALSGVPLLCAGVYFLAGRFVVDAIVRRGMFYAVSDRRVLIRSSWPMRRLITVSLRDMSSAQLCERAHGSGTIRFGPAPPPLQVRACPRLLQPSRQRHSCSRSRRHERFSTSSSAPPAARPVARDDVIGRSRASPDELERYGLETRSGSG